MTRHRTKSNSPMPGYKPSFHLSRFTLNSRNHLRIETHHWTSERWCFNDLTFSATVFEMILNWSRFYSVFGVVLWARARSNCKWMSRATLNYASNKIISIWWVCHALSVSIKTLHNYHNVMAKFKQRYSFILSLEHRFRAQYRQRALESDDVKLSQYILRSYAPQFHHIKTICFRSLSTVILFSTPCNAFDDDFSRNIDFHSTPPPLQPNAAQF